LDTDGVGRSAWISTRPQGAACDIEAYEFQVGVTEVPTLSEWGMIIMAGFLGLISLYAIRRRLVRH